MHITANNITDLYRHACDELLLYGKDIAPRGLATKEVIGAQLVLTNPNANIIVSRERRLNRVFSVAEWLWMLVGQNDVESISAFNSQIAQFSDDGVRFYGAYGPKLVEQLPYVLKTLRNDPASRQAVMSIWRERPGSTKDVPCTLSFQFLLRDKLDMITTMRSNDIFLGLPYDIFNFTRIQAYVAAELGVAVGKYVHNVGSLHVYENHYERLAKIREEVTGGYNPESGPLTTVSLPKLAYWFNYMATARYMKEVETYSDVAALMADVREDLGEAWVPYIQVLAYRSHKIKEALPDPYYTLIERGL